MNDAILGKALDYNATAKPHSYAFSGAFCFGGVPAGSGRSDSRTVALATLVGPAATGVTLTNESCGGVDFGATLSGGVITVTMNAQIGNPAGPCQGILRVWNGSTEIAHAAVFALIK